MNNEEEQHKDNLKDTPDEEEILWLNKEIDLINEDDKVINNNTHLKKVKKKKFLRNTKITI